MDSQQARFSVGQLIFHKLFRYRGVIVDVDPCFMGTEQWYAEMARTRPPRDRPWYRVLVHNASHETYVAERNLEADGGTEPVSHPLLDDFFAEFRDGQYIPITRTN